MPATVPHKQLFWQTHAKTVLNPRQLNVLNKLIDHFQGPLTSGQYAKIARTSQGTASGAITELVAKKVLKKGKCGGRSTHYILAS